MVEMRVFADKPTGEDRGNARWLKGRSLPWCKRYDALDAIRIAIEPYAQDEDGKRGAA
jgi:hypothetical protein